MDAPLRNDGAASRPVQRFGVSEDAVRHCAVSPTGDRAIAVSREVKLYDLAGGDASALHTDEWMVGVAPPDRRGVLTWSNRQIFVWGWKQSTWQPARFPDDSAAIRAATFLTGDDLETVAVTQHGAGEVMYVSRDAELVFGDRIEGVETVWLCSVGVRSVARGQRSGAIDIWRFHESRRLFERLEPPGLSSPSLRGPFSAAGPYFGTASRDFTIRTWQIGEQPRLRVEPLATLTGHTDEITGLAFTPDSLRIISCSRDRTIRIWSIRDGRLLTVLADHRDWVTHIAVNPAGRRLASCSDDGTIKLWDLESFAVIDTAYGSSRFLSLAMSNDTICAGDASGAFWILEYEGKPALPSEFARRYLVSGRVAGVGFRQFVQQFATPLGVRGSVRNLTDGRIEVHVIGSEQQHAAMKDALTKGPGGAQVTSVEEEIVPITAMEGFSVVR